MAWHGKKNVFWHDNTSKETTANAFRTACLPSASHARPRIYPTMQRALGLFWYLTSSCFRAIESIGRFVLLFSRKLDRVAPNKLTELGCIKYPICLNYKNGLYTVR